MCINTKPKSNRRLKVFWDIGNAIGGLYDNISANVVVNGTFPTVPILKSISLTFIGLIPIVVAIIFNFTFMSLFNISLDIATSLVSAMAIGIGIDDALHFLQTFKRMRKEEPDYYLSLLKTVQITGKAIFATSVTLVIGYSVFFLSSFTPIVHFGLLNILTIIMATISTIIYIPLAIMVFKPLKN